MGIRDDFARFTAPDGSLSGDELPKLASGNSLLFSAERLIALTQNGMAMADDLRRFANVVCDRKLAPGLYGRTPAGAPFSGNQESQDDYIGVVATDPTLARIVFENGRARKFQWQPFKKFLWYIPLPYYFPTAGQDDHDPSAWLGRFVGFIAHLRICAGATVWPWHSLAWAYSVALAPSPSNQDSWLLTWVMVWANKNPGPLARLAIRHRQKKLIAAFPGGIRQVFALYFNNPKHPLALWAK